VQVAGHVAEVAMSHTGSRVIQAVVKGGGPEQHERILDEIMPNLLTLCKSPYGHFLVVRLISKAAPNRVAGGFAALPPSLGVRIGGGKRESI
jgi:pumilio homology domain family member 6